MPIPLQIRTPEAIDRIIEAFLRSLSPESGYTAADFVVSGVDRRLELINLFDAWAGRIATADGTVAQDIFDFYDQHISEYVNGGKQSQLGVDTLDLLQSLGVIV